MSRLGVLLFTALAVGASTLACAQDTCRVSETRQDEVDAAGATLVRVDAKAGSLKIMGEAGLDEVQARGTACAENQSALEKVQLRADRSGDEVRVVVEMPEGRGSGGALDLELRVPEGLAIDVRDSSGETEIDGVASLVLEDGSGEIDVTDVAGDVRIRDGSGEIDLIDVGGDVSIHDGSGEIEIRDVEGSVVLEDGSGEIEVEDVRGNVTVEDDSSGGIEISGVGKNVLIRRDSSGGIRVEDVGGDFTVEKDGSGGIEHEGVKGKVDIPD
jgi:hypothetical protein